MTRVQSTLASNECSIPPSRLSSRIKVSASRHHNPITFDLCYLCLIRYWLCLVDSSGFDLLSECSLNYHNIVIQIHSKTIVRLEKCSFVINDGDVVPIAITMTILCKERHIGTCECETIRYSWSWLEFDNDLIVCALNTQCVWMCVRSLF